MNFLKEKDTHPTVALFNFKTIKDALNLHKLTMSYVVQAIYVHLEFNLEDPYIIYEQISPLDRSVICSHSPHAIRPSIYYYYV